MKSISLNLHNQIKKVTVQLIFFWLIHAVFKHCRYNSLLENRALSAMCVFVTF